MLQGRSHLVQDIGAQLSETAVGTAPAPVIGLQDHSSFERHFRLVWEAPGCRIHIVPLESNLTAAVTVAESFGSIAA